MMGGRPPGLRCSDDGAHTIYAQEKVDTCYIRHAYAARQGLCAVRCAQCARRICQSVELTTVSCQLCLHLYLYTVRRQADSNRGQRAKSLTVSRTRLAAGALDYGALSTPTVLFAIPMSTCEYYLLPLPFCYPWYLLRLFMNV